MKNKIVYIYLIRHAESEHNKDSMDIIGGHLDDSLLTSRGMMQANDLGERLAREGIMFGKIYSSTYRRAMKTADIVASHLGYPGDDIIFRKELIEYGHGDFAGRLRSEVYTPEFRKYLDGNSWGYIPPNGESQCMVSERMYSVVEEIMNHRYMKNNNGYETNQESNKVAVFSHGTAIKCLLRRLMLFDPKHVYRMDISNTSITEILYDADGWHIQRINDHAHLD